MAHQLSHQELVLPVDALCDLQYLLQRCALCPGLGFLVK